MSLPSSPKFNRLTVAINRALTRRRSWLELTDLSVVSRPASFSDAATRIQKNFSYFHVNYLAVLAVVLTVSLLSHPLSLLALVSLLAAWLFLHVLRPSDRPFVLIGRPVSDAEAMWILIAVTVFVIFVTDVVKLMLLSFLLGLTIVCVHGAVRVPADPVVDGQDFAGSGWLSLIDGGYGPSSSAAPAAISIV